jgi:hypothetical protein
MQHVSAIFVRLIPYLNNNATTVLSQDGLALKMAFRLHILIFLYVFLYFLY